MASRVNGKGCLGSLLVLEDDPDLSEMLQEILVNFGYEVEVVASSAQALDQLAAKVFHAAILDIHIEDGGSMSVADCLLSNRIPYMFATGLPNPQLPTIHQWATFLQKPYRINDLMGPWNGRVRWGFQFRRILAPLSHVRFLRKRLLKVS